MEWLRSAYQSEWHLFVDQPLRTTAGRYYFSPEGTPFYSGVHNLSSRSWHDKNWQAVQSLGEDLACKQAWDNGEIPTIVPQNVVVGTADCLQYGEVSAGEIPYDELIAGFPKACFVPAQIASLSFDKAADYQSCSIQLAYAKIIEWMYNANTVAIADFLEPFLGPAFVVQWHAPTTLLPSVTTAVSVDCSFVWVDGTVNYQQFAMQALYSGIPPQNQGSFSTSGFWYRASSWVHAKLEIAGADPDKPIFLCGHSYGATAALILAARYRQWNEDREIRYLTYGCPHIGDTRLHNLLRTIPGIALSNDVDLVTAIPPDLQVLIAVFNVLAYLPMLNWPTWRVVPNRSMMDDNGIQTADTEPILDYPTLRAMTLRVIANLPYPQIVGHNIEEYFRRIDLRCSAAEWPLKESDYAKLFEDGFILLESGDFVLLESGDKILLE